MPTTTNKQRLLTHLVSALKSRYPTGEPEARPVLSHFVYAVCREGTTRERADCAFKTLNERFFDWNEIRVSSPRELEEALAELPDAEGRAHRIISLLQEAFETTFSFDLEPLTTKGLKQAARQLGRFQAANDYAVAWVTQYALGGHAVPVDAPSARVLHRLGFLDPQLEDPEAQRASLEHLVPKARGALFCDLVSAHADDLCTEDDPQCSACPLVGECPVGQERRRGTLSATRGGRPKSR